MKVLAINGSPRGADGCTDKVLQPLLDGMRNVGAATETIYLANKKIHHCIGCFSCWIKTPGKCVFNDDMDLLLDKFNDADLVIYAMPLYYFNMPGLFKNFLDRTIPRALPFMEKSKSGLITHPARKPGTISKCLLVSVCGFPELAHFDALVATFKKIAAAGECEYLGEILRPTAEMLKVEALQARFGAYFDLLKVAGKQLIETNKIDQDTYRKLHEPWITPDEFMVRANAYFKSVVPE